MVSKFGLELGYKAVLQSDNSFLNRAKFQISYSFSNLELPVMF